MLECHAVLASDGRRQTDNRQPQDRSELRLLEAKSKLSRWLASLHTCCAGRATTSTNDRGKRTIHLAGLYSSCCKKCKHELCRQSMPSQLPHWLAVTRTASWTPQRGQLQAIGLTNRRELGMPCF
eukprot:364586-Chlamydomonas_euryale.AAC.22